MVEEGYRSHMETLATREQPDGQVERRIHSGPWDHRTGSAAWCRKHQTGATAGDARSDAVAAGNAESRGTARKGFHDTFLVDDTLIEPCPGQGEEEGMKGKRRKKKKKNGEKGMRMENGGVGNEMRMRG